MHALKKWNNLDQRIRWKNQVFKLDELVRLKNLMHSITFDQDKSSITVVGAWYVLIFPNTIKLKNMCMNNYDDYVIIIHGWSQKLVSTLKIKSYKQTLCFNYYIWSYYKEINECNEWNFYLNII